MNNETPLFRIPGGVPKVRLQTLLQVLDKHTPVKSYQVDIILNVIAGFHIHEKETATDLAIAAAVACSFLSRTLPRRWLMVGEIGLGGELRAVRDLEVGGARQLGLGWLGGWSDEGLRG